MAMNVNPIMLIFMGGGVLLKIEDFLKDHFLQWVGVCQRLTSSEEDWWSRSTTAVAAAAASPQ